ncbi:MAG: nickel insertion protein, partial [Actinomycetota bacterium]
MTTAWFHCFAGTAGDMTMAALIDAGADPLQVVQIVGALPVDHYALTFDKVQRCGVGATQA